MPVISKIRFKINQGLQSRQLPPFNDFIPNKICFAFEDAILKNPLTITWSKSRSRWPKSERQTFIIVLITFHTNMGIRSENISQLFRRWIENSYPKGYLQGPMQIVAQEYRFIEPKTVVNQTMTRNINVSNKNLWLQMRLHIKHATVWKVKCLLPVQKNN